VISAGEQPLIGFDIRQDQQPTKIGPDQRQTNQYSLVLNNSGKHIARDVIAQITLTNGRLTSLTNNQSNSGCIALTSQIMKCKLDQLASQAFYDLGFEATAVESATLSFNISVTGNYVDLKPDNNQGLIQMMPRYIEGGSLTNSNTFPTPGAPSPSSQAPSGASEIIVTPQQGGFAWSLVILGLGLLGSARRTNIN